MKISKELEQAIAAATHRQIFCPNRCFSWNGNEGKLDDTRIDHISFLPEDKVEIYLKW